MIIFILETVLIKEKEIYKTKFSDFFADQQLKQKNGRFIFFDFRLFFYFFK